MIRILNTLADTALTTAVIAPTVYNTPVNTALDHITKSHDFTAPLIAIVSSLVIQFSIKGVNWLIKKFFKTNQDVLTQP